MNILLKHNGSWIKIYTDQIMHISTTKQSHLLKVTTTDSKYYMYGTLYGVSKKSEKLIFCNKSTIVNINHIERIEQSNFQIYFRGTTSSNLMCSRRRYKGILEAWKAL
jgi:DNA-binding LytR/AlgR family response regulator